MNQLNQYTIEDNYCQPLICPGWLGLGDPADATAEAFDEPGVGLWQSPGFSQRVSRSHSFGVDP